MTCPVTSNGRDGGKNAIHDVAVAERPTQAVHFGPGMEPSWLVSASAASKSLTNKRFYLPIGNHGHRAVRFHQLHADGQQVGGRIDEAR